MDHNVSNHSDTPSYTEPTPAYVIIGSIQAVITFVGSILCLFAFATLPSLRTPFNLYLISILSAELLLVFYNITIAIQAFYGYWVFSAQACTFAAFVFLSCTGVVANAHFLIAVNRTWALFFPLHYRTHNSKAMAMASCVSIWVASVSLNLPWVILNEPFLWEPGGIILLCRMHPHDQYTFSTIVMILFITPTVFIMLIYPVLYNKQRKRMRNKTGPRVVSRQSFLTSTAVGGAGSGVGEGQLPRTVGSVLEAPVQSQGLQRPSPGRKSVSFLVLTWIAFCAAIFWMPLIVYSTAEVFVVPPNPWFTNRAVIGMCVWVECAMSMDAWMFMVTVPPLKEQVKKLLRF